MHRSHRLPVIPGLIVMLVLILTGAAFSAAPGQGSPLVNRGADWPSRTPTPTVTPIVPPVLSTRWAVQISTGFDHTCALTTEGGVKCWGANGSGQLGDGTSFNRLTPVDVIGLESGVLAIGMGMSHSCAVTIDGGIKCWGLNDQGQLGDGTRQSRPAPVDVVGLGGRAISVGGGWSHTCALLESGGVSCWGDNASGQLGDGTTTRRLTPVTVVGLRQDVRDLDAGTGYNCVVLVGGGIQCWGANGGTLGDGTTIARFTPVDVAGLDSGMRSVSAGRSHTCGVSTDGRAWCWGRNFEGQLGNGRTSWSEETTPQEVLGLQTRIRDISAGWYHTCAVMENGDALCWGANDGALGDGTLSQRLVPVEVVGLAGGSHAISAGFSHTCALDQNRRPLCWGHNEAGQLGDSTTTRRLTPVDVLLFVCERSPVTQIPRQQCAALVALFNATSGATWKERSGWLQSTTPCSWFGVTCEPDPSAQSAPDAAPIPLTVTALHLSGNGLSGVLPAGLGDLAALRSLDLSHNSISGQLPSEIFNLVQLNELLLDYTFISSLPPEIGNLAALRTLRLAHSGLASLPTELGKLSALESLDASYAALANATLPPEMGHMSALQRLDLSNNGIISPLPPEWGQLGALQWLNLSHNAFAAPLPPEWGDLKALQRLDMSFAGLQGPLPPEWGRLSALQELNLSDNALSGPLPPEWGQMPALRTLKMTTNQLSGPLPPEWRHLAAQTIDLIANNLGGTLPPEWAQLPAIQGLGLANNQFSGSLPPEWRTMATLQWLALSQNDLEGAFPPEWGDMPALQWLDLGNNRLSGPFPPRLGDLSSLRWLSLSHNLLYGSLPPTIGNLTGLQDLGLSGNQFSGALPPELGHISGLHNLDLSANQFSGPIPAELGNLTAIQWLSLNHNQLTGPIPPELSNLKWAYLVDLSFNALTGAIPAELGQIGSSARSEAANQAPELSAAARPTLTPQSSPTRQTADLAEALLSPDKPPPLDGYLQLCCNHLDGPLPDSLSAFVGVDVSGNRLSGSIPAWLGRSPQLSIVDHNRFTSSQRGQWYPVYWDNTQTMPPSNLQARASGADVILTWTPILYTADGGFYEIGYATAPAGPFTVIGQTADKTVATFTATGLDPEALHFFRLRTFTPAHPFGVGSETLFHEAPHYQPNDLWSDYSEVASTLHPRTWLPLLPD